MNPLCYPEFILSIADSHTSESFISKNFRWSEFLSSSAALHLGISNIPDGIDVYRNIAYLVHYVLQPLRERCGAIKINSGYRCKFLNEAVDGAKNSYHLYGRAADIVPLHCSLSVLENFIKDLGIKYIRYSTFIHVQI